MRFLALSAIVFSVAVFAADGCRALAKDGVGKTRTSTAAPADCCGAKSFNLSMKEFERFVRYFKAAVGRTPQNPEEVQSKAISLRRAEQDLKAHATDEQLAAIGKALSQLNSKEMEALHRATPSSPNDMFIRGARYQSACRNTDAKLFVEGKSNCLNGVDSLPVIKPSGRAESFPHSPSHIMKQRH
jgi:hypothetical protein